MQSQLKVLAPVITRDVTLPNSSTKVPMVMVPVPDSKTLMAIPLSTINNMTGVKDEQQAKDLLNWNDDGIGTLDGCDLRFKINQLGCLELLDSDDEEDKNQADFTTYQHLRGKTHIQRQNRNNNSNTNPNSNNINHKTQLLVVQSQTKSQNASQRELERISTNKLDDKSNSFSNNPKKAKIKHISPGCSLLRDGPDNRRVRAPSFQSASSSMPLSTKTTINQDAVLLEKLIPKKQIDELKSEVVNWSVEDVKSFVDSVPGCAGNGQLFESQQICGKSLLYLDQKDLVDIVNVKLGPAIKIYNAISLIKS